MKTVNTAQNNDLKALVERLKGAPACEQPALCRALDAALEREFGTPSTDALQRRIEPFEEKHAAPLVIRVSGPCDGLMQSRIGERDPTCSGRNFVGGWGRRGLQKIAKEAGYSLKQARARLTKPSASFIHAIVGRAFLGDLRQLGILGNLPIEWAEMGRCRT